MQLLIPGRLIGLNDYIKIERGNKYAASAKKKNIEAEIIAQIKSQPIGHRTFQSPVRMHYHWVEKNTCRDKDNIAFARKFIQDALVKAGVLINDNWSYVVGFTDTFSVSKTSPRIEVAFEEIGE